MRIALSTRSSLALIIFPACLFLAACGSDEKKPSPQEPELTDDFGLDNPQTALIGRWEQECSGVTGNLAKIQKLTVGQREFQLEVLDYNNTGCSELNDKRVFSGAYDIQETRILSNGAEVSTFEVRYDQATATAFSDGLIDARNQARVCNRTDWGSNNAIDLSDRNACFPLFQDRQQFRYFRIEQGRLFIDNRAKAFDGEYALELDTAPFVAQ